MEREGQVTRNSSYWLSIFAVILLLTEFFTLAFIFRFSYKKLRDDKYLNRIGYYYEELNFEIHGGKALAYPHLNKVRMAVLVAVLILIEEAMVVQVTILTVQTIFVMMWLSNYHPYKELKRNSVSIMNEFLVIIIIDLLLFSSDP